MKIQHRRSNFAQFSKSLWLTVNEGNTSIDFDVEQEELLDFAMHLLDVAYDSLRKSDKNTQQVLEKISDIIEEVHNLNKAVAA